MQLSLYGFNQLQMEYVCEKLAVSRDLHNIYTILGILDSLEMI
jgi:hypothetical protein